MMTHEAPQTDGASETSRKAEWNKGDPMPSGGPLPRYQNSNKVIQAQKPVGAGELGDPRVRPLAIRFTQLRK